MKILKISGRNLASLAGDFCVDFEQEPLASAGLFAITGPTGAGKTTLLDALCLALYDATPRLLKIQRGGGFVPDVGAETVSSQDPRTLLRRGASEAFAEVDFVGNDALRYRARWSVRRSRGKAGGSLQKSAMSLHQMPEMTALGGTKTEVALEIVQRVGLSFDQFTRAVLLAQNEFSVFLKTEENERGELLETLTGSAVYSTISKRAYERWKSENNAMQQLNARLADHTPLAAEARAALDAECAAADAALAAADAQQATLEQQLRWHHEADKLRSSEDQAQAYLAQARAAVAQADQRRLLLETRDAVEPARALQAESARLEREIAGMERAVLAAAAELARTLALREQAAGAVAEASARLLQAEQAQGAALPLLDQAKALDANIAVLAPAHVQARSGKQEAGAELALAAGALQVKTEQLAANRSAHQAGAAWLATHAAWENLALQWPRWDTLLRQAEATASLGARLAAERDAASATLLAAGGAEQQATMAAADAAATMATLEAARQQAISALAAFDGELMSSQRQALELRRDALVAAEQRWHELAATSLRLEQAQVQGAALAAARIASMAALDAAGAQAPGLAAALAQSERSLKAAELACADSVVDLRATLEENHPCPVCGSAEHPYQHQNAGLLDMLASLRAEVARCRALDQDNAARQASERALLAGHDKQLAACLREAEALQGTQDGLRVLWSRLPVAAEAPAEPERGAWFTTQLAAMRESSRQLDVQERAWREAGNARDTAQQACDRIAFEHARAQELAVGAGASLARASMRHAALLERCAQAQQDLSGLLDELDAGVGDQPGQSGWQQQWQAGAPQFRSAREAEASLWRTQSAAQAKLAAALLALEAELAAALVRHRQMQDAAHAAAGEFARIDAIIVGKQTERAALWAGRAVRDIEQELGAAVGAGRHDLAQRQAASLLAAQAETRALESTAQLEARIAAARLQAQAAARQLLEWLAAYPQRHPQLEAVPSKAALDALLALDGDWMAQERSALHAIDATVASAETVLTERRSQRSLHRRSAPPEDAGDAGVLGAALAALGAGRKDTQGAATALRLQLAQDNVRRAKAQSMLCEIEAQQMVELRWGRMNELIGSADGKKFRNYAQQFTLDVLLGYANSHLGQLARRYRLERVLAPSGPSLGLMVRDQDMGDEVRSVNSLSGGESFLVSLALALGLASLSSNRVRVESLFIDEGFGSLDTETLRVAMDALDGLQSMGRKVGIISHVQEMTDRIAARIVVQPSGGGTSTVTVQ